VACQLPFVGDLRDIVDLEVPVLIADRAVLVTESNRGIGQALVEEALSRGAMRVYAGTRLMAESWRGGAAKALERQNAALAAADHVTS
jgi:NAD(P)-dependent dehydrogenase (short-subunit alcohol dehydrogenase family)